MAGNKRSIPEIRDRLREIANEKGIEELNDLAEEMIRNSPARRSEIKSRTITPALAQEIRDYAKANPHLSQQEIASHFNVNHGRVSEALNNLI